MPDSLSASAFIAASKTGADIYSNHAYVPSPLPAMDDLSNTTQLIGTAGIQLLAGENIGYLQIRNLDTRNFILLSVDSNFTPNVSTFAKVMPERVALIPPHSNVWAKADTAACNAALTAVTLFSPASVPGLARWYRPESLPAGGTGIQTWVDSSGNNDATQSDSTKRPTAQDNQLNGFRGAQFDGTNDFLDFVEITTLRSVFFVCKYTYILSDDALILGHPTLYHWYGGLAATGDQDKVLNSVYTHTNIVNGSAWVNGSSSAPLDVQKPSSFKLLEFDPTGNTSVQYITNDRNAVFAPFIVVEVCLFDQSVSAADRALLESWFNDRYKLW